MTILCTSLNEVRQHIDRIDSQMLDLLAERGRFVKQAARFKKSSDEVAAPQRVEQIIQRIIHRATASGAEPAVAEATWRAMITAFIEVERSTHQQLAATPPNS